MEVIKLPRTEQEPLEEVQFSTMSPIGFKLHAYIEHKVITSLDDLDKFKKRNPIHEDYVDDVIIEMIDKKIIKIVDGNIVLLKPYIFEGIKKTEEFQNRCIRNYSELSRQISKKALTDSKEGIADIDLDFSVVIHFADDPEILSCAREIIKKCKNELTSLAMTSSNKDKNSGVRAVSFAGSVLDEEGL